MRSQTNAEARSSHARPGPSPTPARWAAAATAAVMSSDDGASATGAIHGACGIASGSYGSTPREAAVGTGHTGEPAGDAGQERIVGRGGDLVQDLERGECGDRLAGRVGQIRLEVGDAAVGVPVRGERGADESGVAGHPAAVDQAARGA